MIDNPLHPMRRLLLALATVTLLVGGCESAGDATGPAAERCPTARVALCADVEHAALVRAAVVDASTRLVPALEDAAARATLTERLATLSAALDAGEIALARAALADLRSTLARAQAASHATDAADLEGIALTLQEAADALVAS